MNETGIEITTKEVENAMRKIGKNKAVSYDGMSDVIFQGKYYKHIEVEGKKPRKDATEEELKEHNKDVKNKLGRKIRDYLNFCIKEKTSLLYN